MSYLFDSDQMSAISNLASINPAFQQLYQQQQAQSPVNYASLDEAVKKALAANTSPVYTQTPYVNPNSLIPSQYTQEQGGLMDTGDSFAPMRMFQSMQKSAPVGPSNPVATTQFGSK